MRPLTLARLVGLAALPALAFACGGGSSQSPAKTDAGTTASGDGGHTMGDASEDDGSRKADGAGSDGRSPVSEAGLHGDGGLATGSNTVPMVVNGGFPNSGSVDVPFISVQICVPGTSSCQTVDFVAVDTGSTGMRVISSALTVTLPQAKAGTGDSLAECYTFGDGYVWGSVRTADLKIGGEVAANVPIQLVGDPGFTSVPGDCSSTGPAENTVDAFGSNALIGINQIVADCGTDCTGSNPVTAAYYSCNGSACTATAVPVASQVPNPISLFAHDSNGSILQFPAAPAAGEASLTGSLIFGIGTAANNGLGSAKVLTVDEYGNFTTIFNGRTLRTSYIDSGTNALGFNDSSIPQCTSMESSGFFCPTSTVNLSAQNKGLNNVTTTVSFSVANSDSLFSNDSYAVFDDLATPGDDNNTFAWGFPFFLGRSVYVALEGASTPGGSGPYFAY